MRHNPDTDRARFLDDLAAESRASIAKNRTPVNSNNIQFDKLQNRWVPAKVAAWVRNVVGSNG